MLFVCFHMLFVHGCVYAHSSAHAFFEYLFCILDEKLRMKNVLIYIRELFSMFYLKLQLAAAFQC